MTELREKDYYKAVTALQEVTINHHFALSVAEQHIKGKIFVDDAHDPKTFYIAHPYGMGLLMGACDNPVFNQSFRQYALNTVSPAREHYEWMQAFPAHWDQVLPHLLGQALVTSPEDKAQHEKGTVELYTRVNFQFNRAKYLESKNTLPPDGYNVVRTNAEMLQHIKGSVVPHYFWNSQQEFLQKGIGFSVLHNGELASTAFSAFIHGHELEIGIETAPGFGGKGLARLSCSALIDYCLENDYEPIWACRFTNTSSYILAQKLGFEPTKEIPYYKLSK